MPIAYTADFGVKTEVFLTFWLNLCLSPCSSKNLQIFEISEFTRVLLRSSVHASGSSITGVMESIPFPQALKPVRHHHRHSYNRYTILQTALIMNKLLIRYSQKAPRRWLVSSYTTFSLSTQAIPVYHPQPLQNKLPTLIYLYLICSGFADFLPLLGNSDSCSGTSCLGLPFSATVSSLPLPMVSCCLLCGHLMSATKGQGRSRAVLPFGYRHPGSSSCHHLVWCAIAQDLCTHTLTF